MKTSKYVWLVVLFLMMAACNAPGGGLFASTTGGGGAGGAGGAMVDAGGEGGNMPGEPCDDAGGRWDRGGACCHQCLSPGFLCEPCDAGEDAVMAPILFVCGAACPPGYSLYSIVNTPGNCGMGSDCSTQTPQAICYLDSLKVVRGSCNLAACVVGGPMLAGEMASCDCDGGGAYYVCAS